MKVTFLGTGTSQGVPVIGCDCDVCRSLDYRDKRLRTSAHVEINGTSLVIDTGPDFREQMLRHHVSRLDAVLFTHAHRDHTSGLDDIRAYNFLQNADIPVYGTAPVLDQLQSDFRYIFQEKVYPGIPRVQLCPIDDGPFEVGALTVTPLPVMHLHLPVMGFRIGPFSYITDANFIPDTTLALLKDSEVLVLNALQKEPHISHFTLDEALAIAGKVGARQTYLVHISHKLGRHKDVSDALPPHVALAYDGLEITL